MQKSHHNKEKSAKTFFPSFSSNKNISDSNANSTRNTTAITNEKPEKNAYKKNSNNHEIENSNKEISSIEMIHMQHVNYMDLEPHFELGSFNKRDTQQYPDENPVSYHQSLVTASLEDCNGCTETMAPLPPTPPPISQLPGRAQLNGASVSAPVTPSRGKVVLSRKERKELRKLQKQQESVHCSSTNINKIDCFENEQCVSPYKGRVNELRNCIAKINSRGFFSSINRNSQKHLSSNASANDEPSFSPEPSPPPPAPCENNSSIAESSTMTNNNTDHNQKLKNLPVRQRKVNVSHMENYCLFDPIDFINEKTRHNQTNISNSIPSVSTSNHGLRDPLFSSRSNLAFSEEEAVPEVIYDDDNVLSTNLKEVGKTKSTDNNFDHHNYFVIDPENFEGNTLPDIGIPNPFTNEEIITANLSTLTEAPLNLESICKLNSPKSSPDKSFLDELPSNSQESQFSHSATALADATMNTLESYESTTSSTSSTSNSSKCSAITSQTNLQYTKKKLTFFALSPFRLQNKNLTNSQDKLTGTNITERAFSEVVNADQILQLQHMLDLKDNARAHTVPVESNYVLFNPGPVPSRNLQYKIRKPRPLSTHSDADSGFLSPCSPDDFTSLRFNPAVLILQQCDSVQGYIEIYTDWANYYLERFKSKKKVTDLSADCRDGLLLADVIEAVTNFKVPDLIKKPKNQQQMYDNVNSCLNVLRSEGVSGLDNITPTDICVGRLKAVLALFFALSRFKQQSKQSKCVTDNTGTNMNRQIPTVYSKTNGSTAIPLPATVMVQRRCPPDKVRPLPPTPNHTPSIPGLDKSGNNFNTSRPNSPPTTNHTIQSLKTGNNNSVRPTSTTLSQQTSIPSLSSTTSTTTTTTNATPQKYSMLDKFKLFNKERQKQNNTTESNVSALKSAAQSKRTSSSSGFSSARSERSDSSLSLNDNHMSQIKPPTVLLTLNKNREAKTTKQFKTVNSQLKKEQLKANRPEKTEKNTSRTVNKNDGGFESKSSTMGRSKNSLPRVTEKNIMKTSSRTSLNSKTESKNSLLQSPNGTGLPKPIAAIKGTSKLSTIPTTNTKLETPDSLSNNYICSKKENDISNTLKLNHDECTSEKYTEYGSKIIKPVPIVAKPNSKKHDYANAAEISQLTTDRESNNDNQTSTTDSNLNNSRLPPPKSNLTSPVRMFDNSSEISPIHSPIKPNFFKTKSHSQPSTPTNSANKYHTVPSKIVGPIYEEDKPVSVLPMRPLLRGYNSHVTLPTRGSRGIIHYTNEFCDSDVAQGYYSDCDSLRLNSERCIQNSSGMMKMGFHDIETGYVSDSSGTLSQNLSSGNIHIKNYTSFMRTKTQLPTTIEERIRSSQGSLDSITAQHSSTTNSSDPTVNKMSLSNSSGLENSGNTINSPQRNTVATTRATRDKWSRMPESLNGHTKFETKTSPSSSKRPGEGGSNSHSSSSKQSSPSGRTKNVPPSFGYIVKRPNSTAAMEPHNSTLGGSNLDQGGRTAHVSAVPRSSTGRKSTGGTQTLPTDITRGISKPQHRSFSLTGPGATQLSQSIRERLVTGSHSLPKPGSDMHVFQHKMTNRKMMDGSLSDTQTYAEVKPEYNTYAMWLKQSSAAGNRLSEGDSLESIHFGSPSLARAGQKILQHRNATGISNNACGSPIAGNDSYAHSPRLNRSNSIRSTKSEKVYPSILNCGLDVEIEPYYCLPVGALAGQQNGLISAHIVPSNSTAISAGLSKVRNTQGQSPSSTNIASSVGWSQPTSPTPANRCFAGTLSPTQAFNLGVSAGIQSSVPSAHRLTYPKKNDEVHGSAASLLSGGSSLYGSAEERQAHEIRRLKRELIEAREQVLSLSSQLSTNAHVVAAFEQSLSNMTSRLQQLTATSERKDDELTDMRQTIELLRKQSVQAGLTTAHMQSMGVQTQKQAQNELLINNPPQILKISNKSIKDIQQHQNQNMAQLQNNGDVIHRHHSSDSMCSLNSISSSCSTQDKKKKKGWLRSSFTKAFSRNAKISKTSRHIRQHIPHEKGDAPKNENYHDDSRKSINVKNSSPLKANGYEKNVEPINTTGSNFRETTTTSPKRSPTKTVTLIDNAKPIDAIDDNENQVVEELKKQLREKDLVLTDIRLEALSSASQLESLKETVNKMRAEMLSLKQNNERLQKLVTSRSLTGSDVSLSNAISPSGSMGDSRRYSLADNNIRPPMELPKRANETVEEENVPPDPAPEPSSPSKSFTLSSNDQSHDLKSTKHIEAGVLPGSTHKSSTAEEAVDVTDGKKISIACYLGQPESFPKYCEEILEADAYYANSTHESEANSCPHFPTASLNEFVIAYTYISGKTTWQNLDYIVRKTFKDYLSRIDPGTNLGLNTDSITSYHLGEAKRGPEVGFPELLPCGYIIGNVRTLYICLQGVGSLAFDSLIPRSIVHRYISLLTEHRRLILCGPSGTGKSYLARRLAEFIVARSSRGNPSEAIATFNVDHKSSKELRQYLSHIAEQTAIANGVFELPSVIILDNLHHASALGDVFSCLLSAGPAAKLPCIIGTMSQATCNTTNLQLHHNFRWVLTANHMEPVKGFLGRFLRRRLFQLELTTQHPLPELATVLAWLPTVWQHINRFLEIHSSSDVTIGPRLFLSCPLDLKDSQVWFTDIWNYHLSPYLVEAVREGVQLYGRRGGVWNDPSAFIRKTYPWPYGSDSVPPLRQINAEDVGLEEGVPVSNGENQDPLLNMLMRLQEAANYSECHDQESDCASLDSNLTPDSSAGAE